AGPRGEACLRVVGPAVGELVAVRVATPARVERDRLADADLDRDDARAPDAVDDERRVVVGPLEWGHGPVHPGGEVVLERLPPSPDRRLVRDVRPAVLPHDLVHRGHPAERVPALRPDGPRLAVGLSEDVAAAPAAPTRATVALQAVGREAEEGG